MTNGKLVIDGDQSGATGLVSVVAAATLSGTGTIGGAVSVFGTLAPGNSPGLLTIANDATLQTGSVLLMELAGINRGEDYDALNVHDDQFDAAEASLATAISIAAVAALTESWLPLIASWVIGGFGLFMTICGFAGWPFHPDVLSTLLG